MSAIVLFDGVCNFCNSSVNFIIERDSKGYFKFAPLQSEIGEKMTGEYGIDKAVTDSIVLIEDGQAFTHSTAALRIAKRLDGAWRYAYAAMIIPRPLRDLAYRIFAKYRYRMFGRQEACMIPTPELRERFISTAGSN